MILIYLIDEIITLANKVNAILEILIFNQIKNLINSFL